MPQRTPPRDRCRAGVAAGPLGRSVTDLLATLQELEHLGVGFVSLTQALDLATPAGRAMAGLLAVFAAFEREILVSDLAPDWPTPGRTASVWDGQQR
jgi:hypothetical protein